MSSIALAAASRVAAARSATTSLGDRCDPSPLPVGQHTLLLNDDITSPGTAADARRRGDALRGCSRVDDPGDGATRSQALAMPPRASVKLAQLSSNSWARGAS